MRMESELRLDGGLPEECDAGDEERELVALVVCCWRLCIELNAEGGAETSTDSSSSSSLSTSGSPKSTSVMRALRRLPAAELAPTVGSTVCPELVDSASETGRGVREPTRRTVRSVESLFRQSSAISFALCGSFSSRRPRSLRCGGLTSSSEDTVAVGTISGGGCTSVSVAGTGSAEVGGSGLLLSGAGTGIQSPTACMLLEVEEDEERRGISGLGAMGEAA